MIFQDAYERAQRLLDESVRPIHNVDVVISGCEVSERAFAFWYDARSYLESDAISDALVGNGPVIVPKSASLHSSGQRSGRLRSNSAIEPIDAGFELWNAVAAQSARSLDRCCGCERPGRLLGGAGILGPRTFRAALRPSLDALRTCTKGCQHREVRLLTTP